MRLSNALQLARTSTYSDTYCTSTTCDEYKNTIEGERGQWAVNVSKIQ